MHEKTLCEIKETISNCARSIDENLHNIKHNTNQRNNIPHIEYAHKRLCVEEKRKQRYNTAEKEETKIECLKHLTNDSKDGCMITRNRLSRSKGEIKLRRSIGKYIPPYPKPVTGLQYTRAQVYHVLSEIPSVYRGIVIDDMIIRKLVPCGRSNLYKILRNKTINPDMILGQWDETITRGRKPFATISDIKDIVQSLKKTPGRVFGENELKEKLQKIRKQGLEKNFSAIGCLGKISNSSYTNYKTTTGCLGDISFVSNSIIKSNTQFTAEHSLMSTMSFLHTVATTHFRVFDPTKTNATYISDNITEGAKELIRRVKFANKNRPINCVRPQYLFSTDDTTEYIFLGADCNRKNKWSLVANEGIQHKSHKAIYKVTKKPILLGMRVKMTFTLSGIGGMAPIFITVPYLTEQELSTDNGFLPLKIKGLCIGGSGLDPHNEGFVFLLFT